MNTDEETINSKIDMKFHNEDEFRAAKISEDLRVACFQRKFTRYKLLLSDGQCQRWAEEMNNESMTISNKQFLSQ